MTNNDSNFIYGEPEIAVNPRNPSNMVYVATAFEFTPNCQANPSNPNHSSCQDAPTSLGPQPVGIVDNVPGFDPNTINVSFDRGRTWKSVTVPTFRSPFTGTLMGNGDPAITVTSNGTFYFSQSVLELEATQPLEKDAGVLVSKSTDGGRTWSTPVLTGTAADRDFITADTSTGIVYEESGAGPLGPVSTANPNAPTTGPDGRYLVASTDGVHWTKPEYLGAGISGPYIAAARGEFATGSLATGADSSLYCGTAATCVVFQTTTDAGATWSRHAIPNSADASDGPLIAADPANRGHFTVAYLNAASTALNVVHTSDNGKTWSTATVVSENTKLTQWKPWIAAGPDGTVALMWRTWTGTPGVSPYNVWAAVSRDGGRTFTNPLEVSNGNSAAPWNALGLYLYNEFADDFSYVTFNGPDVYVAWAAWTGTDAQGYPVRQGMVSKIPLGAFFSNSGDSQVARHQ